MELFLWNFFFTSLNRCIEQFVFPLKLKQGPPSPYQELVIEGDAAREVYSNITNDSHSIQEQPPVYQVLFTRDSELEVIQNFTNNKLWRIKN